MPICPRCCEATVPTTAYRATLDVYDGSPARSWCCGRNGWRDGIAEEARSTGPASTRSSSAIRFRRRGSSTAFTPTRAKLPREEPDAGNLHVRVCEGWGWRHPHLLGIRRDAKARAPRRRQLVGEWGEIADEGQAAGLIQGCEGLRGRGGGRDARARAPAKRSRACRRSSATRPARGRRPGR